MPYATPSVTIAQLVDSKIVTADGRRIGRVVDVEVTAGPVCEVTALIYGRYGWLYRLHVMHPLVERLGIHVKPKRVPWEAVARYEPYTITTKPDYETKWPSASH